MAVSSDALDLGQRRQERLGRLKEALLGTAPTVRTERARAVTEFYRANEHLPIVLKRAGAFAHVLASLPVYIRPDELIVGGEGPEPGSVQLFPDYSFHLLEPELDTLGERVLHTRFLLDGEDKRLLREEIFPYWRGRTLYEYWEALMPPEAQTAAAAHMFSSYANVHGGIGHTLPDYAAVLTRGLEAIAAEAESQLHGVDPAQPESIERSLFWKAAATSCRAVVAWAKRHAAEARRLAADESDPGRRDELLAIARVCEKVPGRPAETFHEALQSLWFAHLAVLLESKGISVSFGRFDQYMYPFYAADLASGCLTAGEAEGLLECFWMKCNESNIILDRKSTDLVGPYTSRQALTIGGVTADGLDATNDLTYLCLRVQQTVGLHQPSLSLRCHPAMPDQLLLEALRVVRLGTGLPAFFNDESHVWGLLSRGVALKDARDYAVVGCVEPSLPGRAWANCSAGKFNLPKCLMLALNDGVDPTTGLQLGPATGDPDLFTSFPELFAAYERQVAHFVALHVASENCIEAAHAARAPVPFLSTLIADCIAGGRDVTAGGARYNFVAPQATGQTNVGDSLAAIERLVYQERALTMAELREALRRDFAGREDLRQRLLHAPKYGNDDDFADFHVRDALRVYTETVAQHRNGRGGRFHSGAFPSLSHVLFGRLLGATPDGRRAGEPFATGVTPMGGRDRNGVAAVVSSAGKLDYLSASNGTVLTQWFHPTLLADERGVRNLAAVIRTYFEHRGQEIQFNVVSAELLREAQRNPEQYRSLVVRVTGWSAFFVGLEKEIQDEIIARTEHVELG